MMIMIMVSDDGQDDGHDGDDDDKQYWDARGHAFQVKQTLLRQVLRRSSIHVLQNHADISSVMSRPK